MTLQTMVKTGDLVLFSSDHSIMRFILRFTHVGIVVGDNRILEMHAEGDAGTEGLENLLGNESSQKMYRLDERLAAYPGRVWIASIRHRLPPMMPSFFASSFSYNNAYVAHHIRACVMCLRPTKAPTSISCAEFVAIVLRDVFGFGGVETTDCYTPASLAAMPGMFERPKRIL